MGSTSLLLSIGSGFGLSSSAGLNAYIPLLMIAIIQKAGLIDLVEPYSIIGELWVIIFLTILLIVEVFADKITFVDHVNDIIQTLIRPTSGAIAFVISTGMVKEIHPYLAIFVGLVLAGGVHIAKSSFRPAVTATTAGTGNSIVSLIEDIYAFIASLLSIIVPIFGFLLFIIILFIFYRYIKRKSKRAEI